MRKDVTFNNRHCSQLRLKVLDYRIPLLAENRDTYIDVPFRNSSILVPDNSKRDLNIEVDFLLKPHDNTNIYDDVRAVALWLSTSDWAPMVFDDDPNHTYTAKVTGGVNLDRTGKARHFTVTFRCKAEG